MLEGTLSTIRASGFWNPVGAAEQKSKQSWFFCFTCWSFQVKFSLNKGVCDWSGSAFYKWEKWSVKSLVTFSRSCRVSSCSTEIFVEAEQGLRGPVQSPLTSTLKQWLSASDVPKSHLKNFKYICRYLPFPHHNIQGQDQGILYIFQSLRAFRYNP